MFHFVGSSMASITKQLQMNDNCWNKSLWPASSKIWHHHIWPSSPLVALVLSGCTLFPSLQFPTASTKIIQTYIYVKLQNWKKNSTHSIDHMAQGRPTQPLPPTPNHSQMSPLEHPRRDHEVLTWDLHTGNRKKKKKHHNVRLMTKHK